MHNCICPKLCFCLKDAKMIFKKRYFCNFDVSVKSAEEDVPRLLARPHMPLVGAVSDHNLFCHHHQWYRIYFVIIIIHPRPILSSSSSISDLFCHHHHRRPQPILSLSIIDNHVMTRLYHDNHHHNNQHHDHLIGIH